MSQEKPDPRFDVLGGLDSAQYIAMVRGIVKQAREAGDPMLDAPAEIRRLAEMFLGTPLASFPLPIRPLIFAIVFACEPEALGGDMEKTLIAVRAFTGGALMAYEFLQSKPLIEP